MALKVGLTGGIGSGKSTVARIFEVLNVPVYYADAASKNLYDTDPQLMQSIKVNFGEDVYSNNHLIRSKLAEIVFRNPEKLELLNSLVHPPTIKHAEEWMMKQSAPYLVKEAALIFESGSAAGLDYVIGVHAPLHIRIHRVMERDQTTREQVIDRMKGQIDEEIKMRLCDFIIRNDEQQLVIPQVLQLHEKLLQLAEQQAHHHAD